MRINEKNGCKQMVDNVVMNKQQIIDWLSKYNIENYVINDDLSVDVNGDVDISCEKLTKIPVKFGSVSGGFSCSDTYLTSLKHCPTFVGEHFSCAHNNLTSLKHCPTSVGGHFSCYNNNLPSLEHCPTSVGEDFYCDGNDLVSLEHCPTSVGGVYCGGTPLQCPPNVALWLIQKGKDYFKIIKDPTEEQIMLHEMLWLI